MRNVLVRKRIPRPLSFRHRSSLARAEIGFITDVEGDWSYFEQCIARSRVLYRDGSKKLQLRAAGPELTRGSFFVFGGDAFDPIVQGWEGVVIWQIE